MSVEDRVAFGFLATFAVSIVGLMAGVYSLVALVLQ